MTRVPWNKGLTAETDPRVAKYVDALRKPKATCVDCGRVLSVRRFQRCKSCETRRRWQAKGFTRLSGPASPFWKGGTHRPDGYVEESIPSDDFFASMARSKPRHGAVRVLQHRLVMARHLKRCLLSWEVVHHKNGLRDDNRLENLELISDRRFHLVDAEMKRRLAMLERRVTMVEAENVALRAQLAVEAVAHG
jgi:hypothetical protein